MLPSMVIVCPLAMVTLLVLVGTPVGVQMAAFVQLPLALEVFVCDNSTEQKHKQRTSAIVFLFSIKTKNLCVKRRA
jgi:hypothetical protein